MSDCTCDMRTRLVGDGCQVCNPSLAAELSGKCEAEDDQLITAEWMMTPPNAKPCGRGGVELYLKPGWRVSWFDGEVQIEYFVKNMFSQSLTLKGVRSTSDMLTLIRLIEGGDE